MSPMGCQTDETEIAKRYMLYKIRRVRGNDFLAREVAHVTPERAGSLRMQMGLGFLKRQNRYAFRFIKLSKEMLNKSLEKENDRKALEPLAVSLERKPGPIRFVA